MRIRLVLAWYDLWIGAYWDRASRTLYLMVPMIGVAIELDALTEEDKDGWLRNQGQRWA